MSKVDTTLFIKRKEKTCSLFKPMLMTLFDVLLVSNFVKNLHIWWRKSLKGAWWRTYLFPWTTSQTNKWRDFRYSIQVCQLYSQEIWYGLRQTVCHSNEFTKIDKNDYGISFDEKRSRGMIRSLLISLLEDQILCLVYICVLITRLVLKNNIWNP